MADTSGNTNWERIQQGVGDTERLIGQKDYNSAMIKARQTLECMVKLQLDRACIPYAGDLKERIDSLYENHQISKITCEHYHSIRIIGNRAAHEGENSANDANQAYHMLSQEVYTFANDYGKAPRGARNTPRRTSASGSGRASSAPHTRSRAAAATRSRRQPTRSRREIDIYALLKLMVPILSVILLIFVIRLMVPKSEDEETTQAVTTQAETTTVPETTVPETMAPVLYRTTTVLNVRSQPNTDGDPIGKLAEGTTVDYVEAYNEEWAVIRYNGAPAYVASRYLTTE